MVKHGDLVSIVIPVFNVKPYLAEALESVFHQTYENIEIIIIDDGSTDGSETMCDEFLRKDARVRVVHQANRGLSNARNVGLDLMKGSIVAFLDPDDVYHSDYIASMMEAMVHTQADLVLCQYTVHKTKGRIKTTGHEKPQPIARQGKYDRSDALRALTDGVINVSVWNKLYRRELWEDIRFPDGHVYEDSITTYRVFDICQLIYVLNKPLYLHRIRPGSITGTYSLHNFCDLILASSSVESFIVANTPDIFAADQIIKKRQASLNGLICVYLQHFYKYRGATRDSFKEKIMEEFQKTEIESFSLRTRAAYWMLSISPSLLWIMYSIYHPVRLLVWTIIGK